MENNEIDEHFIGLFSLDLDKLIKSSNGDLRISAENLQEIIDAIFAKQ